MIEIRQIQPSDTVSSFVRKISLFQSRGKIKYLQKLTPSAYSILSYNYGDIPVPIINKEKVLVNRSLQIAGPKTDGEIFVEYDGELKQILIEFTATGFYYLFHKSPNHFENDIINLKDFLGNNHTDLETELQRFSQADQLVDVIEKWILEKSEKALPPCDYIEKAASILERANGHINISELSSQIFKSERQFERQFKNIVGISPKYFSKIIQLHHVINLMHKKEYGSIQDISYQANYYDAPSFSRNFKEMTGFSPTEFLESDDHIALKYLTDLP